MARLRLLLVSAIVMVAVTHGSHSTAKAAAGPPRAVTWLAAGDSYSSGYGIQGASGECSQAPGAWPNLARQKGPVPLAADGFLFRACHGATTGDLFGREGRTAQWEPRKRFDLVTFSFGGNDVGFAIELEFCVRGGLANKLPGVSRTPWLSGVAGCRSDAEVRKTIEANIGFGAFRDFLKRVATEVVMPGGNLVVVGYPAFIEEPERWSGIAADYDLCNGIKPSDARNIRGWAGLLDSIIGKAADDVNRMNIGNVHVTFVNVQDGVGLNEHDRRLFEPKGSKDRHNLCSNASWMLPPNALSFAPWAMTVFHPNALGHQNQASLISDVLKNLDWSKLESEPTRLPPGSGPSGGSEPPVPPGSPPLNLVISENPFICNGQSRVFGRVSGAVPGERIEFSSPQATLPLAAAVADSKGEQVLRWTCEPGASQEILLNARSASGRIGSVRFLQSGSEPAPARCAQFTVYAQNRWDPQGASKRASPDHNSTKVLGYGGNAAIPVNGWTYGSTPFPNNPVPFNNNVWYRVADGSGWVSFPGVRASTTSYAPNSPDGGPPAPTLGECKL